MKVRVVPRDADNVFVHGKAGVIEHPDGQVYSFVGSVNDWPPVSATPTKSSGATRT